MRQLTGSLLVQIMADNVACLAQRHYLIKADFCPRGTIFSEISIRYSEKLFFKKLHLEISFEKCPPYCSGLNVLMRLINTRVPCE